MATIRQEINILVGELDTQGTNAFAEATNGGVVQLDTTQYSGTITCYFEIVAKNASANNMVITLRRVGTTTDDATITITDLSQSTFTRYRSASFTPSTGATQYFVQFAESAGDKVRAARIVIIQNSTTLTSTETQIEIGNKEIAKTNTVAAALTNPKYWLYTSANWDGTKTFYAEIVYMVSSTKGSGTITLQEDNGSFGAWADKVTIVSGGIATTPTRIRSASFTPVDGRHYRIATLNASSKSTISVYNAKIIVDQAGANTTTSYYFDASQAGPTDSAAVWTNDANAFDSDATPSTKATTTSSTITQTLDGTGTTAPTSGNPITQVRARTYTESIGGTGTKRIDVDVFASGVNLGTAFGTDGAAAWGSYSVLTVPSGGWTWAKINALQVKYKPFQSLGGSTLGAYKTEVEVTYGDGTTALTLFEPQYLLLNTTDAGTGLQSYQTLWDSTEWSGVTNSYKYSHDATNAADASKLVDIDNGNADVTGATVTGANQQISSAFTMPTTGHQVDTNVTVSTGVVGAVRILTLVSVTPPVTTPVGRNIGVLQNTFGAVVQQAVNRGGTY